MDSDSSSSGQQDHSSSSESEDEPGETAVQQQREREARRIAEAAFADSEQEGLMMPAASRPRGGATLRQRGAGKGGGFEPDPDLGDEMEERRKSGRRGKEVEGRLRERLLGVWMDERARVRVSLSTIGVLVVALLALQGFVAFRLHGHFEQKV